MELEGRDTRANAKRASPSTIVSDHTAKEMVENSLSSASLLMVFSETFFLTFRLMERTWTERERESHNNTRVTIYTSE
ncbi:hypothetical protein CRUP_003019 [Coryphaenoides rupestris]|nr:hypothetical protein CRUP_003019 [Coryphaenoides rupestris]